MAVSHWYHLNTYLSLAIIVTLLVAAIVFSVRRANQVDTRGFELAQHDHTH